MSTSRGKSSMQWWRQPKPNARAAPHEPQSAIIDLRGRSPGRDRTNTGAANRSTPYAVAVDLRVGGATSADEGPHRPNVNMEASGASVGWAEAGNLEAAQQHAAW